MRTIPTNHRRHSALAGFALALCAMAALPPVRADVTVVGANDLGMHCADLDYQVFSILPPFNVVHAQAIETGSGTGLPRILSDDEVTMYYRAAFRADDPAGPWSVTTTSLLTDSGEKKTNFWDIDPATGHTFAYDTYGRFYPYEPSLGGNLLLPYEPLQGDGGIPVPDTFELANGNVVLHQQAMPGANNKLQPFRRFDRDLPFFENFPFGTRLSGVNWFSADGIPIVPIDDSGQLNPYPLALLQARDATSNALLGTARIVLPVANEANCQNCHAAAVDGYSGIAADFAAVNTDADPANDFPVMTEADARAAGLGPEYLLNAAKMNILRLHDANHGGDLRDRRPVQCSQCHYSPALDLAQVGPIDEPQAGPGGRQQTTHVSMSRAMHGYHGRLTFGGERIFPAMPPRINASGVVRGWARTQAILAETCYQCHPGSQTQCLRGAMAAGGMVCQDCHGNMPEVGNDFSGELSASNAAPAGLNLAKRVPWASEPACQSCHTGDALQKNHPADGLVAKDGIRLLQAFRRVRLDDGTLAAQPYHSPGSRFAEDQILYRLSKGHGGVMCKGCHGSTHAIFPNPDPNANDNVTTRSLQGHSGTLTECSVCHAAGTLGATLDGPHGMHPVNDSDWIRGHKRLADGHPERCSTCHGTDGLGTVLSRLPVKRTLLRDDDNGGRTLTLGKGYRIGCVECHENGITHR